MERKSIPLIFLEIGLSIVILYHDYIIPRYSPDRNNFSQCISNNVFIDHLIVTLTYYFVLFDSIGEYINGECQCNPGWKGKECSLRHDECEVPDCNGHGHCTNGKCNCVRGYKGKYCEEVDCPHPTCSGHGFCAEGTCICKKGWKGADCSQMDKEALQCLPDCSGHGNFDLETQTCLCEPMWSGDDCSKGKEYQNRAS